MPRRREKLHRKRQNDRRIRFRGLSGGIQVVRRDDVHRRQDGVVYQKDLGKKTDVLAKAMKKYNPDSRWQKAEVAGGDCWGAGIKWHSVANQYMNVACISACPPSAGCGARHPTRTSRPHQLSAPAIPRPGPGPGSSRERGTMPLSALCAWGNVFHHPKDRLNEERLIC